MRANWNTAVTSWKTIPAKNQPPFHNSSKFVLQLSAERRQNRADLLGPNLEA